MSRLQRMLVAVGAGALLFLTLGAWSLSSPVGSSPDDDFHLASIWCGQGERAGLCEPGASASERQVPDKAIVSACYAMKPATGAACQGEEYLDEGFSLVDTTRVNSGNQYPSGFYYFASVFTNDNIAVSVILIRLANSAVFSVLAVLTWCLLPLRLRPALALSSVLTLVPVGFFFIASTNPSSWALISGALVLPALMGYFASNGWTKGALGGISVLAAFLAFGARGDSAAYTIVAAAAAIVLSYTPTRRFWLAAILPVALVIAAAVATLGAGQIGLATSGDMGGDSQVNQTSKLALAALNLMALPDLWAGAFGHGWGIGWLDTDLPSIVSSVGIVCTSGVLFLVFRVMDWRRAVALAGVALANLVVPTYILVQSGVLVGSEVQPRYIMPLITLFVATALFPSASPSPRAFRGIELSRLQLWIIALGFAGANAFALFSNLRRYVTTGSYNLDAAASWWWEAGPSPFGVLAIGALSGLALLALIALSTERSTRLAHHELPQRAPRHVTA